MRRFKFLFLLSFIFLSAALLPQNYSSQYFDVSKGLPSNFVNVLYQDSRGYLWIATLEGISKFNGKEFLYFPFSDETRGEYINSIVESKRKPGVLYIGTLGDGILKLENNHYTKVFTDSSVEGKLVESLSDYDDSSFIFSNKKGIYQFNEDSIKLLIPKANVSKVLLDKSGNIWMANDIMLCVKLKGTGKVLEMDLSGASLSNENGVTELSTGEVTFPALSNKILFFKDFKLSRVLECPGDITFIKEDNQKNMWIGTRSGLLRVPIEINSLKNVSYFNFDNGQPSAPFASALIDKENNIWFSTAGRGVLKYENTNNFSFNFNGMSGLVFVDKNNNYWVPCIDGVWVLHQEKNNNWKKKLFPKHVISKNFGVFNLQITSDDLLWLQFSHKELYQYKITYKNNFPQSLTFVKGLSDLKKRNSVQLSAQSLCVKDLLFYATGNGGLEIVDIKNESQIISTFSAEQLTPLVYLRIAYIDRDGNLWIGGIGNCLLKLSKSGKGYKIVKKYTNIPHLDYQGIRAIVQSDEGKMWFGSRYNGLYCLDNETFTRYTIKDGLLSNQITSLSAGNNKRIWVGTISGICYVDYTDSLSFGINKDITPFPVYSSGTVQNNLFWAATNFGISFFDGKNETRTLWEPRLYFNSFLVNGEEKPLTDGIELSYSERNCAFDFEGVTFNSKSDIYYQFYLKGFEQNWQNPVKNHSVTYADLSPGTYTFFVRMLGENKKPYSTVLHLTFTIIKPVWLRWWFITSALLLVVFVITFFERLRVSHLLKIEKIRSRIASDLHDDIGSGLTRIAMMSEMINQLVKNKKDQNNSKEKKEITNNITLVGTTEKIGATARELIENMSDVVWSVDPQNDSFDKLISRIKTHANEICDAQNISLQFEVIGNDASVNPGSDILRCLLLVSKESLTNIVKHAACNTINISFEMNKNKVSLLIADNGKGFNEKELSRINGLNNMRRRIEKAGGEIYIDSVKGEGTKIITTIPILII